MNACRYILPLLLLLLATSCRTVKKAAYHSTERADTTREVSQVLQVREREVRDSLISVPARAVQDTIAAEAVSVRSATTGRKRPVQYQKTDKGLTAWVAVDTMGNITYGASADSFVMVVKGLIREVDSLQAIYLKQQLTKSEVRDNTETIVERRTFADWLLKNFWWVGGILLGLGYLIKLFLKSKIPF